MSTMPSTVPLSPRAPGLPVVPLREVLPWALFALVNGLVLLYVAGVEQGAVSLLSGEMAHELLHDGRHLLGFPCH